MSGAATDLAGILRLRPGSAEPVRCERPVVAAGMLRKLTRGRRAVLLPDLLGALFTLCSGAHRLVARRAVLAALGEPGQDTGSATSDAHQARLLALLSARDHLQRLALDLPGKWPVAGVAADPSWLRLAPVWTLATGGELPAVESQQAAAEALPRWLEHHLLGLPPAAWLAGWQADPEAWLATWAAGSNHPLARWYADVAELALATRLPCRALGLLGDGDAGLRHLAGQLASEPGFAERPVWHGVAAETGAWTRRQLRPQGADVSVGSGAGASAGSSPDMSLWLRLGARLAEVVTLSLAAAREQPSALSPAIGALTLAPGQALAWCEMSRGLLIHWVQLEPGSANRDTARVDDYHVLAPTEWNFHPYGALADALRERRFGAAQTRLATLALDPCVAFDLVDADNAEQLGAGPAGSARTPFAASMSAPEACAPATSRTAEGPRHA
jgi:hypothetical protein